MQPLRLSYPKGRCEIRTGDVLLFAWKDLIDRIIADGKEFCHAAMAVWSGGRLLCREMTIPRGQESPLSVRCQDVPRVDVYDPDDATDGQRIGAADAMADCLGVRYGWKDLIRMGMYRVPIVRLLVRRSGDDDLPLNEADCSAEVSRAWRTGGGIDLLPGLSDRDTEPGDLALPPSVCRYKCSIIQGNV